MTKKQHNIFIPLVAIGVVLFAGYEGFGWRNDIDSLISKLTVPQTTSPVREEAWAVLEEYMDYANAHDLEGVKRLSHQISETCANDATREECNALMNSVYTFFSYFRQDDFKNVLTDGKKITLFTDYRDCTRVAYYFVRDNKGNPKVAGMRFCQGDGTTPDQCSTL